jgi:hypothetical protein
LLIARETRWHREVQDQVEIGVVVVVTQCGVEIGRQVGVGDLIERAAAETARGIEDRVLLRDIAPDREVRMHGRVAQGRRSRDVGAVGIRRRDFHHVA